MKLAAIDIGSNAVRLQITRVIDYEDQVTFKKLEYVRFPLRLGHDVFTTGRISEYNKERFYKLMTAYKNLIDLYEVDSFFGCATSAIRESENGKSLIEKVREGLGLEIKVISGDEEAEIINKVIGLSLDNKNYLHVDVGGGSTELNIYEGQKIILSRSFKLGSVRSLEKSDEPEVWEEMKQWIKINVKKRYESIIAIGTGGNINKLFELSLTQKSKEMSLNKLIETQALLLTMSEEKLLKKLQLNPDRADVILPASDIYIQVMESAGAKNILVPDVGLKDGLNYHMYELNNPNREKVFVRN
jgi:exopolyphosphatase/guanosine-5'-triphosphate,3'-diphosphate pyrophosphatase